MYKSRGSLLDIANKSSESFEQELFCQKLMGLASLEDDDFLDLEELKIVSKIFGIYNNIKTAKFNEDYFSRK